MRAARHLVIFTRYPKAGAGKRRLAAGVGDVQAVRFSRVRLVVLVARMARDLRWTTLLAVTPDGARKGIGPWPAGVDVIGQGRGDLGQRMGRVFRALPPGPVVIIGSDCPAVRGRHVARAFAELGGKQAVFGPASDGGYWLVGLDWRQRKALPFEGVRWSSEFALADTVRNIDGPVALVDRLDDVDDARDLARCPDWGRVVGSVK